MKSRETTQKWKYGKPSWKLKEDLVTMAVIIGLTALFVLGVIVNYYLWNWLAPKFGWSEIGFWWFVPIAMVTLSFKFLFGVPFIWLAERRN